MAATLYRDMMIDSYFSKLYQTASAAINWCFLKRIHPSNWPHTPAKDRDCHCNSGSEGWNWTGDSIGRERFSFQTFRWTGKRSLLLTWTKWQQHSDILELLSEELTALLARGWGHDVHICTRWNKQEALSSFETRQQTRSESEKMVYFPWTQNVLRQRLCGDWS